MNLTKKIAIFATLGLSAALATPLYADPPAWSAGKSEKHESKEDKHKSKDDKHKYDKDDRRDRDYKYESRSRYDDEHVHRDQHGNRIVYNDYFRDSHRSAVHDYYDREFRAGHCPPGLAKKRNGCVPPGQAKKWYVGRPLPSNVQYYPLPHEVVNYLGQPPAGYQYVRVDNDVLLLGTATRVVIDVIRNLGF